MTSTEAEFLSRDDRKDVMLHDDPLLDVDGSTADRENEMKALLIEINVICILRIGGSGKKERYQSISGCSRDVADALLGIRDREGIGVQPGVHHDVT